MTSSKKKPRRVAGLRVLQLVFELNHAQLRQSGPARMMMHVMMVDEHD